MRQQTIAITNSIGLHARPAALLVRTAAAFASDLAIVKDGRAYNVKSLLAIMSAGVKGGTTVTLTASGEDEAEALTAIVQLIQANFGES